MKFTYGDEATEDAGVQLLNGGTGGITFLLDGKERSFTFMNDGSFKGVEELGVCRSLVIDSWWLGLKCAETDEVNSVSVQVLMYQVIDDNGWNFFFRNSLMTTFYFTVADNTRVDMLAKDCVAGKCYSIQGMLQDGLKHGINIIKYPDGKAKKLLVK